MSKSSLISLAAFPAAFLVAACGGGGYNEPPPFATAAEVQAAYAAAPRLLNNYFQETVQERGDVNIDELSVDPTQHPSHLVIQYKGEKIYDRMAWWGTSADHGLTSRGDDVIVLTEYETPVPGAATVVFFNGVKYPLLQSLPTTIAGYQYAAWTRDIREYRNGWLILFGSSFGRGGWHIDRYALYHPASGQFFDCGEFGSNRHPEWGPSADQTCVRR